MLTELRLDILPQPDDSTCGPTCLHAIYRYFGDSIDLDTVIRQTSFLEEGGTLAVLLGCHALQRGYAAHIYTFNLNAFDPSWFQLNGAPARQEILSSSAEAIPAGEPGAQPVRDDICGDEPYDNEYLIERLTAQMAVKSAKKLHRASKAYIEFLRRGGRLYMHDLTGELIRRYLVRDVPVLAGLSSTYLYWHAREYGPKCDSDDIRGLPAGHFVVLCGYDPFRQLVRIADPYLPNPLGEEHYYYVSLDRLVCAILLGVLTYDANLLVLMRRPPSDPGKGDGAEGPGTVSPP